MKYVILAILVLDVLLVGVAGVRISQVKDDPAPAASVKTPAKPAASAAEPAAPAATTAGQKKPGEAAVDALTTKGGSDAPEGLEGAVGANRPTYDVDVEKAGSVQDDQEQSLEDAKNKIKKLPGGGG